jgi:hypothetical protein
MLRVVNAINTREDARDAVAATFIRVEAGQSDDDEAWIVSTLASFSEALSGSLAASHFRFFGAPGASPVDHSSDARMGTATGMARFADSLQPH